MFIFQTLFFLLSFPATASKTQTLNAQTLFLEIRIGLGVTWFTKKENTHHLQDHNYIWYHMAGGRLNYKAFLSCLQRKSDEACVTIRAWSTKTPLKKCTKKCELHLNISRELRNHNQWIVWHGFICDLTPLSGCVCLGEVKVPHPA